MELKTTAAFLSDEQVRQLNEKHGWFYFGDAQSDVSRAFAQDAIAMHERMRAAAPALLDALDGLLSRYVELVNSGDAGNWDCEIEPQVIAARAAIAKATRGAA